MLGMHPNRSGAFFEKSEKSRNIILTGQQDSLISYTHPTHREVSTMTRSPPLHTKISPGRFRPPPGQTRSQSKLESKRTQVRYWRHVLVKIQDFPKSDKPDAFDGAVGRGPARQTQYGISIDVVRIDGEVRTWGDLVPTNPEILSDLRCGDCISVVGVEVIKTRHRPMWRGTVRILG